MQETTSIGNVDELVQKVAELEQQVERLQEENRALHTKVGGRKSPAKGCERKQSYSNSKNRCDKHLLERIIQEAPVMIAVIEGPDHRMVMASPRIKDLSGWKGELTGATVAEVWGDLAQKIIPTLETVYETGNIYYAREIPLPIHRDGNVSQAYFNVSYSPLWNENGEIDGILVLGQESTEEVLALRRVEESEKRYRRLVDSSNEGICYANADHLINYINIRGAEILGYTPEEMMSMSAMDVVFAEDIPTVNSRLDDRRNGISEHVEVRLCHKDGHEIWVRVASTPIFGENSGYEGILMVYEDITGKRQVEEALRLSEERFSKAFYRSPNALLISRLEDGCILEVNAGFEEFFGYRREEAVGKTCLDLSLYAEPKDYQKIVECTIAENCFCDFEVEGRTKVDEVRYMSVSNEIIHIGDEGCLLTTIQDVTERTMADEALKVSENKYRELVQNANSAIVRWRCNGTITFFNEFAQQFFGYTVDEVVGKHFDLLIPEVESTGKDLTTLASEILAYPEQFESNLNENVLRDGTRVWMAWTNRPIYDSSGEMKEILSVGSDMTDRKFMEQALQDYAARLERSNEDLERFAFLASHDMQEPLRKIKSFGDRIKEKIGDQIDDDTRVFLDRMQDASKRMQQMIDGLLELSRVNTRGQPFVMVDLKNVADDVVFDLENRIQETGAQVVVGELPEIKADPVQMHQLLLNLIGNAIKYHEAGAAPHVNLDAKILRKTDKRKTDMVRIYVSDDGIGFDDKLADRIFLPFERLVGRSAYEGSGMGLAICKKIVERHNGTISARSRPGQGSTFIITLPV